MKKLLIVLLLIGSVEAQEINPAPCVGIYCNVETPQEPEVINPMPPIINELSCPDGDWFQLGNTCFPFKFSSHVEAERHWYSSALGINIWGDIIQQHEPDFPAIKIKYDMASSWACYLRLGFEVFPKSNVCSSFLDQKTAEAHYEASLVTNFQYWTKLNEVRNKGNQIKECADLGWGGAPNNQARWKPSSETTGRLVVLLPNNHCSSNFGAQGAFGQTFFPLISNMRIEDQFGNVMDRGRLRHCRQHNNGRLHWDFAGTEGLPSPVFLRYEFEGADRCRRVNNPSADLGRDQR
jgi:hypothetical protein